MRVAMERMSGVDSVNVSLEEGLATVRLGPENRVTLEEIRERVRLNGFTPKEAEVRVAGRIVESDRGPVLQVPSIDRRYRLLDSAGSGAARVTVGEHVIVRGRVPESSDGDTVSDLRVLEIERDATGAAAPGAGSGSDEP